MRIALFAGILSAVSSVQGATVNTLSDSEKAEGWQLMFDGKSLAGWHSYRKTTITESGWIVKDSSIYLRGPAAGALLAPEAFTYRNFEISIDWKLPDSGNSGIFLRYLETEEREAIRTGPETQICGRLHPDYKGGTAVTSPGACYAMYAPSRPWINPGDEFNTLRVIMFENKVAHFGNSLKLLEYTIGDSGWTARYEVSKYNSFPLYGDIHAGKLFLQDHASHVWYRNIKIRPLADDPWSNPMFLWPDQRVGIRTFAREGFPMLRSLTGADGRIRLLLGAPGDWALAVRDVQGRTRDAFSGRGTMAVGRNFLPAGRYWITGRVDDIPLSGSFLIP